MWCLNEDDSSFGRILTPRLGEFSGGFLETILTPRLGEFPSGFLETILTPRLGEFPSGFLAGKLSSYKPSQISSVVY